MWGYTRIRKKRLRPQLFLTFKILKRIAGRKMSETKTEKITKSLVGIKNFVLLCPGKSYATSSC